jgi:hypothetical protein
LSIIRKFIKTAARLRSIRLHRSNFLPDHVGQLFWGQDLGTAAKTQDPAQNFLESANFKTNFDTSALGVEQGGLLRGMPSAFLRDGGSVALQFDPNLMPRIVSSDIPDAKGPIQIGPAIKIRGAVEFGAQGFDAADPWKREGSQSLTVNIEGDQVPTAVNLSEMQWMDLP